MILVDTNIISELWKPMPAPRVIAWFDEMPSGQLHISAITLGELHFGIKRLPEGKRRQSFMASLAAIEKDAFLDRILPFGHSCSDAYGSVRTTRERGGRPIDAADAAIAATALTYRLTLATRNTRDFEGLGLDLIDLFEAEA